MHHFRHLSKNMGTQSKQAGLLEKRVAAGPGLQRVWVGYYWSACVTPLTCSGVKDPRIKTHKHTQGKGFRVSEIQISWSSPADSEPPSSRWIPPCGPQSQQAARADKSCHRWGAERPNTSDTAAYRRPVRPHLDSQRLDRTRTCDIWSLQVPLPLWTQTCAHSSQLP